MIRAAVLFGVLTTTACGIGDQAIDPAHEEEDVETLASPLLWGPCPEFPGLPDLGQECTTVSVPLDYGAPHGQKIDIAISRVRTALPDRRRGVMLLNPGGPGGPGLDLAPLFAILLPPDVLEQYDMVGFDPRGAGRSAPLSCGLTGIEAEVLPWEQPGGFDATVELVHHVADLCGAAEGDLLPFMNSANTVRDMDRIRRGLGESKIAYYGVSGGTNLGAIYASLFPGRTDRFVLDSNIDPDWRWHEQWRQFGPAGEFRFPDLAAFVAAGDATYHFGATVEEVRAGILALIEHLNQEPIILSDGTAFSGHVLRLFTFGGLYNDASFSFTAELWRQVKESPGDVAGLEALLATQAAPPDPDVPADNYPSVDFANVCGDVEWPRSVEQYRAEYDADRARYGLFGAVGSNIHPCAFWPVPPIEPLVGISSRGPKNILMVQNLRDPATPVWGALAMHAALGRRSRMVTVDAGGHGVLFGTNVCGIAAMFDFLATGVLPEGDPFCPAEPPQTLLESSSARDQAMSQLRRRLAPPLLPTP